MLGLLFWIYNPMTVRKFLVIVSGHIKLERKQSKVTFRRLECLTKRKVVFSYPVLVFEHLDLTVNFLAGLSATF